MDTACTFNKIIFYSSASSVQVQKSLWVIVLSLGLRRNLGWVARRIRRLLRKYKQVADMFCILLANTSVAITTNGRHLTCVELGWIRGQTMKNLYHNMYCAISLHNLIPLIIKTTIFSIVIVLKNSYFLLILLPSCYQTVCYQTAQ